MAGPPPPPPPLPLARLHARGDLDGRTPFRDRDNIRRTLDRERYGEWESGMNDPLPHFRRQSGGGGSPRWNDHVLGRGGPSIGPGPTPAPAPARESLSPARGGPGGGFRYHASGPVGGGGFGWESGGRRGGERRESMERPWGSPGHMGGRGVKLKHGGSSPPAGGFASYRPYSRKGRKGPFRRPRTPTGGIGHYGGGYGGPAGNVPRDYAMSPASNGPSPRPQISSIGVGRDWSEYPGPPARDHSISVHDLPSPRAPPSSRDSIPYRDSFSARRGERPHSLSGAPYSSKYSARDFPPKEHPRMASFPPVGSIPVPFLRSTSPLPGPSRSSGFNFSSRRNSEGAPMRIRHQESLYESPQSPRTRDERKPPRGDAFRRETRDREAERRTQKSIRVYDPSPNSTPRTVEDRIAIERDVRDGFVKDVHRCFHEDAHRDFQADAYRDFHEDAHRDFRGDAHRDFHEDTHRDFHEDAHRDFHEDTHRDFHEDNHRDFHEDCHRDVHEDTHRDFHEDTHRDVHEDTYRDVHEDTYRDVHEDTHRDVHEDTHRDVHEDTHRDVHEDTDTDIHEDTDRDRDIHEDTHRDVHEDAYGDVRQDAHKDVHQGGHERAPQPACEHAPQPAREHALRPAREHALRPAHENAPQTAHKDDLKETTDSEEVRDDTLPGHHIPIENVMENKSEKKSDTVHLEPESALAPKQEEDVSGRTSGELRPEVQQENLDESSEILNRSTKKEPEVKSEKSVQKAQSPELLDDPDEIRAELSKIAEAMSDIKEQQAALLNAARDRSPSNVEDGAHLDPKFPSPLASLIERNQTKAAASAAVFRPLCYDTVNGLNAPPAYLHFSEIELLRKPVSYEAYKRVKEVTQARMKERDIHNLNLRRRYCRLQKSWRKQLIGRDQLSKEEQDKERSRDRFLVASNYSGGTVGTRSASGRLTPTPQEVDMILERIEAEGGTPGSVDIWSTTLADIPNQDRSRVPYEGGSVLIEDPLMEHFTAQAINFWTREEKLIFLEKYMVYQKNFRKIASFLEHKSNHDVVEFYYKNKLKLGLKELPRILASVKKKSLKRSILEKRAGFPLKSLSVEKRGLGGSDEESSDHTGNNNVPSIPLHSMYSNVGLPPDEASPKTHWNSTECAQFLQGLVRYGTDFRLVSNFMRTRSASECKEYYRLHKRALGLDQFLPPSGKVEGKRTKTALWTPEEERAFKSYFKEYGKDWKRIAELMAPKTAGQVKGYWQRYCGGVPGEKQQKRERELERKQGLEREKGDSKARETRKDDPRAKGSKSTDKPSKEKALSGNDVRSRNGRKRDARDAGLQVSDSKKLKMETEKRVENASPASASGVEAAKTSPSASVSEIDAAARNSLDVLLNVAENAPRPDVQSFN